jgi:hypothetical protein
MKYIKYFIVFFFLLLFHVVLSGWWLVVAWCLLGMILPIFLKDARFPLLVVLIFELIVGLLFWTIVWDRSGILTNLALNFQFPTVTLAAIAIITNTLIAFFCIGASLYIRKWILGFIKYQFN